MAQSTGKSIYPLCMTSTDLQPGDTLSALFYFAYYKQVSFSGSVECQIFVFAFLVCMLFLDGFPFRNGHWESTTILWKEEPLYLIYIKLTL